MPQQLMQRNKRKTLPQQQPGIIFCLSKLYTLSLLYYKSYRTLQKRNHFHKMSIG